MKSFYLPVLGSTLTLSQYLMRWGDGVVGFDAPIQIHSGTNATAGDLTNPWLQVDLSARTTLTGIQKITLYNRNGPNGCRTFAPNDNTCRTVLTNTAMA